MPSSYTPNTSNANNNNWIMICPGFDNIIYKLTEMNIPGITLGNIDAPYRGNGTPVPIPGDNIDYEDLSLTFFIDSNFNNYRTIFDKIIQARGRGSSAPTYDLQVSLLDNQGRYQGVDVLFERTYPYSLADMQLKSQGDELALAVTAGFKYRKFDFVRGIELPKAYIS